MFTNPSPLVYPNTMSQQNSYLNMNQNPNQFPANPKEMEMIMRQKWNESQQTPMQSDPYTQFQNEMYQCSPTVKNKIMNDDEYKQADYQCELLMKQALEEVLIPQLINTPNGRLAFERLAVITKNLKQRYIQEEVQANEQLQKLMSDEVVLNRLRELQNNHPKTTQPKQSKPVQVNTEPLQTIPNMQPTSTQTANSTYHAPQTKQTINNKTEVVE